MFNVDDYNDNVEYCRYVWEKNIELGLDLNSATEIQYIANKYLDEVCATRGFDEDEVFKKDSTLLEIVRKNAKRLSKFNELKGAYYAKAKNEAKSLGEELIDINLAEEKEYNRNGGYGYNESYDDHGLDEVVTSKRHR